MHLSASQLGPGIEHSLPFGSSYLHLVAVHNCSMPATRPSPLVSHNLVTKQQLFLNFLVDLLQFSLLFL